MAALVPVSQADRLTRAQTVARWAFWCLVGLLFALTLTYLALFAADEHPVPGIVAGIIVVVLASAITGVLATRYTLAIDGRLDRIEQRTAEAGQVLLDLAHEVSDLRHDQASRDAFMASTLARVTGRCETLRADVTGRLVSLEATQELPTAAGGHARGVATIVNVTEQRAKAARRRRRPRRDRGTGTSAGAPRSEVPEQLPNNVIRAFELGRKVGRPRS